MRNTFKPLLMNESLFIPLNGALSSNSLPKDIRRIAPGLDGFVSHSV